MMDLPEDLPEGYYLDNFNYLMEFVSGRYSHLLTEEEKIYFQVVQGLSADARRLYVRLTNRKGPWFRCDKLSYDEIECLEDAISELLARNLLGNDTPGLEYAVHLCGKDELLEISLFDASHRKLKKAELIEAMLDHGEVNPVKELGIRAVEVLGLEALMVYRLLFFGNFHQDMTEFVMHELVNPFEKYDLSPDASAFRSRSVVNENIELKLLSELSYELTEADETGDLIVEFAEALPARPSASLSTRRYDRMVNRLARQLERLDRLREALLLYERTTEPPSRERQARLHDRLGDYQAAISLCEIIHADPMTEEEREFSTSFGNRIAKKRQLETRLPVLSEKYLDVRQVTISKSCAKVEDCATAHFRQTGYEAFYVENALFNSTFGLAFWDIIFAPVAGAFFNPFQRGPADLYTTEFCASRQGLINQRMQEIRQPHRLNSIVWDTIKKKAGVANAFVYWGYLDARLLELALDKIPVDHYIAIFSRMLQDLKNNTSGFPDLVLFNNDGYELVEIKGPGDKIQKNQERWFRYFHANGIPANLTHVEWASS